MKKCVRCGKAIPCTRKKSSRYCSDECYYEAKKERSTRRYALLKAPADEIRSNESILAYLYDISVMDKPIYVADLIRYNFNFSLSTEEHLDDKKRLFKFIGKYGYHIDREKNLTIWKSK